MMKHLPRLLAGLLLLAGSALPAFAQAPPGPPPTRVRGTITAVKGDTLSVTDRDGQKLTVMTTPDINVSEVLRSRLRDVKDGSFIGTAAMPQADGTLVALEIQVFPEALRGVGVGNRGWDLRPQSTMTNGTVGNLTGRHDRTLTLSYPDGEKKVLVPANVPVITYANGTPAMLKKGAHVMLNVNKAPDGTLTTNRAWVGRGSLVPPM
jgi:hypothetical protein